MCYEIAVQRANNQYRNRGTNFEPFLQNYSTQGDYLNYSRAKKFEQRRLRYDASGVPQLLRFRGRYCYHPVNLAQFALYQYGKLVVGEQPHDAERLFLQSLDQLLAMQDEKGAFPYPFSWRYYLSREQYEPGWVSAMAQGQALSALARAYLLTHDMRYYDAAAAAMNFLYTPCEQKGVMASLQDLDASLYDYVMLEEYVASPCGYTLNGFMFTMLGVYDWSTITGDTALFEACMRTLVKILPYYDVGGFSAYDLGYITHGKALNLSAKYHAVHIFLLHALGSITHNDVLKYYEDLWASYVCDPKKCPE